MAAAGECVCGAAVLLTNKALATRVGHSAWAFLAFAVTQAALALALLLLGGMAGVAPGRKPFSRRRLLQLGAAPLLHCLLLVASLQSLRRTSVPTLVLSRNVVAAAVAAVEWAVWGARVGPGHAVLLACMAASALAAGAHDLLLDTKACVWLAACAALAALYSLYVRRGMGAPPSALTLAYYNSLAAAALLLPAAILAYFDSNSYSYIFYTPYSWRFLFLLLLNGVCGFGLKLSSFWTSRTLSPSTRSVLAACSKLAIVALGALAFPTSYSPVGRACVVIGLATAVAHSSATTTAVVEGQGRGRGNMRFRYGPSTASIMRRVDSDILLTPISHPVEEDVETSVVSAKDKQALVHVV